MSDTTTSLGVSLGLQVTLHNIHEKLKYEQRQHYFNHNDPDWQSDMVPVFPRLANWFPKVNVGTKEERDEFRHGILMALVGRAIMSQKELSAGTHKVLKEVLKYESAYLTRKLADELSDLVSGPYRYNPWEIPTRSIHG